MTRRVWKLLFRRVRWSDGAVASFWFDRVALGLLALSVVWCAVRCEMAEQKALARADAATAEGRDRSAARYRARARRERRYADFIRRQADRY